MIEQFRKIGIDPHKTSGEEKVRCPNCERIGKKNIKDKCLSINLNSGLYLCHKCGYSGCVKPMEKKEYIKPDRTGIDVLNNRCKEYLKSRGISESAWVNAKLVSRGDAIMFPYLRDNELVNYKIRNVADKKFFQAKDAEPIIYNYDNVEGKEEVIFCEGEIDCLSFWTAGYKNVTSVNQGAPNVSDKSFNNKIECVYNSLEAFRNAKTIYIAVDKDDNGKVLEKALIEIFGKERCKVVEFPDGLKDANEVLTLRGSNVLVDCLSAAHEIQEDGIFGIADVYEQMLAGFNQGKRKGTTTYWQELDLHFTHRTGEVTLWTGYMNEGKSTFVKQLLLARALKEPDFKVGVFSPEEFPADEFYDDLAHMIIGKPADRSLSNHMSLDEYKYALELLRGRFFFIYPEAEGFGVDSILGKMEFLIARHGVSSFLLDPYNQFDHEETTLRDDLYIGKFMSKMKRFVLKHDVAIHLVAHQVTPTVLPGRDYDKPSAYRVKGGGTFADKTDNLIAIWRPKRITDYKDREVIVSVQKIKKQRLTGIPGDVSFQYDFRENRYYLSGRCPIENVKTVQAVFEDLGDAPF